MDEYTRNLVDELEEIIGSIDDRNLDLDDIIEGLKTQLSEDRNYYFQLKDDKTKEEVKQKLIMDYNLVYCYQYRKNIGKTFRMEQEYRIPEIYIIDQNAEKFEIDETILEAINIEGGLTTRQALELLKWTSNNTRDNLNIVTDADVYGNDSLAGFCGLSQFLSLYPLQQLGLEVTINNVSDISGGSHAFGTVIIPIKEDNKIVNKRYLIDCTYRQFFDISENCLARYLDAFPDNDGPKLGPTSGYFIVKNDETEFAKELLKNGFIEADEENLRKYLKPFFSGNFNINETEKIDEQFNQIDVIGYIETKQREFDYDESEFMDGKVNLVLTQNKIKSHL